MYRTFNNKADFLHATREKVDCQVDEVATHEAIVVEAMSFIHGMVKVSVPLTLHEVATNILHKLFNLAHKYQSQPVDFASDEYKEKALEIQTRKRLDC